MRDETHERHPMTGDIRELARHLRDFEKLFVLTGAGCSTASGIPDYRDRHGEWKLAQPIGYQAFTQNASARRRYWLRSMHGWPRIAGSQPGPAHNALADMESMGRLGALVTQNVDRLHQRAGSRQVIDLHGRLDRVVCLDCGHRFPRASLQHWLRASNRAFRDLPSDGAAPDGDAVVDVDNLEDFSVPTCPSCTGVVKPDVVFFGEAVPKSRVENAYACLNDSEAVLVVGSSLMVYSGYRFCRRATAENKPIFAINLGRTRADDEIDYKLESDCGTALSALVEIWRSES
jgi:NAD-dependent SIR2 family protein deacetylase